MTPMDLGPYFSSITSWALTAHKHGSDSVSLLSNLLHSALQNTPLSHLLPDIATPAIPVDSPYGTCFRLDQCLAHSASVIPELLELFDNKISDHEEVGHGENILAATFGDPMYVFLPSSMTVKLSKLSRRSLLAAIPTL